MLKSIITILILTGMGFQPLTCRAAGSRYLFNGIQDTSRISSTALRLNNGISRPRTGDNWLGTDKGQHFLGSMITMIGMTLSFDKFTTATRPASRIYGAGVVLSLGVGKECRDRMQKDNIFSYKDLLADVLGICAGGIIVSLR
jgi:uncharacterized protein YfiM (DUF2279 family)